MAAKKVADPQIEYLVQIMEENPALATNASFGPGETEAQRRQQWKMIAATLNSAGFKKKSGKQWRAYWREMKYRTKARSMENPKIRGFGTGVKKPVRLSRLEERVLAIIGHEPDNPVADFGDESPAINSLSYSAVSPTPSMNDGPSSGHSSCEASVTPFDVDLTAVGAGIKVEPGLSPGSLNLSLDDAVHVLPHSPPHLEGQPGDVKRRKLMGSDSTAEMVSVQREIKQGIDDMNINLKNINQNLSEINASLAALANRLCNQQAPIPSPPHQ